MRSWVAFSAIGAGLILVALAPSSGIAPGIALAGLGFTELGWGVVVLTRDRLLAPRLMRVAVLAPAIFWCAILLTAVALEEPAVASALAFLPMAVETLFGLGIAAIITVSLRRTAAGGADAAAPSQAGPYRFLVGLLAGALLVSALTTPALAATQEGVDNPQFAPR